MKNFFIITFIFLLTFTVKSIAQCPLNIGESPILNNNGLGLHFPFNGNVQNSGTGANTATLSGATYTSGICGQALQFDGFNDYVQIDPYINMNGDFTIAAWIYLDTLTYEQEIFTTREQCQSTYRRYSQAEIALNYNAPPTTSAAYRILYMINQHQNCTSFSVGDRYEPINPTLSTNNWFFLTVTIQNNNTENRIVNFYYNCEQMSSTMYMDNPSVFLFNGGYNYKTYIGGGPNVGTYHYSLAGKMDEFRLYNRVLTESEILNLYYSCKPLHVNVNISQGCYGDSAIIELKNLQKGIKYQLFDSTNQQFVGNPQIGSCNNQIFMTGLVTTPTDFYIKAENMIDGCKTTLDTIITLTPSRGSSTFYDTVYVCHGDSILINNKYYYSPSVIYDTIINAVGCDSVLILNIASLPLPYINIGNDTVLCNSDSILLNANGVFSSILWSNSSNQNSIYINSPGLYWVQVTDTACRNSDTILISDLSKSKISLNDTSLCEGNTLDISLPGANTYVWSTGSSSSQVSILESGSYWVSITDLCKSYSEDFVFTLEDCSCLVTIPNAFTPNSDGYNDFFFPVIDCILIDYQIYIYNRWGKLLFDSKDQNSKWDGKYNGAKVPDGVYFYLIQMKKPHSTVSENQFVGSVTLYR